MIMAVAAACMNRNPFRKWKAAVQFKVHTYRMYEPIRSGILKRYLYLAMLETLNEYD